MSNFLFLVKEFESLKTNAVKSEMYAVEDPDVSAFCSRKALETTVKFIYKIEDTLDKKFAKQNDLKRLLDYGKFKALVPSEMLTEMHFVRDLGNKAVHETQPISKANSMYANQCIYKLQRWMVEVYSSYGVEGEYDQTKLIFSGKRESKEEIEKQSQEQERLAEENAQLQLEIEMLRNASTVVDKKSHKVRVEGLSEKETRQRIIDLELIEAGYEVETFKHGWDIEYKLFLEDDSLGYVDYVIWSDDRMPLAVIEAKKTSVDVSAGKHQARRYAEALEAEYGEPVLVFVTNGRVIEYSDGVYPFREVHSVFPRVELVRALRQRKAREKQLPSMLEVDNNITDRAYQKRVIKSVLKHYEAQQSRALLVMATGTGKTRVSASVSDILIRAGWVQKVLFLADRKELVKQASNNFNEYLDETTVNLVKEKRDLNARMHFGTYETVHNFIEKGNYNPAYFDLIVVDEAHRTIYKKYRAIFEYFDALVLGLTATPADEVHRNTYSFFQAGEGEPTDSYGLRRAIEDGNLVNFEPYEIDLGIVKRGLKYAELSEDEKEEWEDKFDEEEEISSDEINKRVLNKETNEKVLQYLQQHGLKIDDGNKIGKSIIFAKNKKHAEYIKKVFDALYPSRAKEAQIIHSEISHVESLIDNFKNPNKNPQIAISVDMLDTGIDVPELLNLVFFKPVKSKIKFWQMIGRGTRLSPNLLGEGKDKEKFVIFDFCANFSYFDIHANGSALSNSKSLKERLFLKRVGLLSSLEEGKTKEAMRAIIKSQVYELDTTQYHLKKVRHIVESLHEADFDYMTDELKQNLKAVSEYIEDSTDVDEQRYQMLTLNAQEAITKRKDSQSFREEIEERCFILKSKANSVNAIKEQEKSIDEVLDKTLNLENIDELERLKDNIGNLANLSKGVKALHVESDFRDKVEDIRQLKSGKYIEEGTVETEVNKVLSEYIKQIPIIAELKEKNLIEDHEIDELKHEVFPYEKIVEDKLNSSDEFRDLLEGILNASKKEIANKIFDNYIEAGSYSQKQTEVMNQMKNILFGKKHLTLEASLKGVKSELVSDVHPLATVFEGLSDEEQEMVVGLIGVLGKLDGRLSSSF